MAGCLLLKQESCKPLKLHSGYWSASCHKLGRKNTLALKNQDFFWQYKLHDWRQKLVGGLFTLYIWNCLDTWAWDCSHVSHSSFTVASNATWLAAFWGRTSSRLNDYSVDSINWFSCLPCLMTSSHDGHCTLTKTNQVTFTKKETHSFKHIHSNRILLFPSNKQHLRTGVSCLGCCTLQAPGWDWVSSFGVEFQQLCRLR